MLHPNEVVEFLRLNRKRAAGLLSAGEFERWQLLKDSLSGASPGAFVVGPDGKLMVQDSAHDLAEPDPPGPSGDAA
jgi:hypothetical protein